MKKLNVKPGDVVVTNFGLYQHWSIVSDSICSEGYYKLISASQRSGTVKEEPWHITTAGKETYVVDHKADLPVSEILENARSQIDEWDYSVARRNCEHFVNWTTKSELSSKQVSAAFNGAATGITIVAAIARTPAMFPLLGGAIAFGMFAVLITNATKKKDKPKKPEHQNKPDPN